MMIAPCQTVREAEKKAFAEGCTTSAALMDAVVERMSAALHRFFPMAPQRVVVYAGTGNNAGDAIGLAARYGCPVTLRCAGGLSPDSERQWQRVADGCCAESAPETAPHTLILDGLLGSGAHGALRPAYAALVEEMNALRERCEHSLLVAIDVPTGLDADTGAVCGSVVRADVSCPIGCVKPGMLADGAEDAVGRLLPVELPGIALTPSVADRVLSAEEACVQLPRRAYSCFKNRAGRVAIVAGSVGMLGAAQLCAESAVAAGAGLVVLYCHADTYPLLAARVTAEVMVKPVASYAEIDEPQAQTLVIGPGLGKLTAEDAAALQTLAHAFRGTVVLDADGLNLAAEEKWVFSPNMILTPHPGEMRRLDPRPAVSRRETVQRFLAEHDVTLLLKGARTLIADRSTCFYNSTGGPHMANGGQGDVLSGVVGALAAQGLSPLRAAAAGAYRCGLAAERAWVAKDYAGVTPATDVLRAFR